MPTAAATVLDGDEGGMSILLLVDDVVETETTELLEAQGHTVTTVHCGNDMMDAVAYNDITFDAILVETELEPLSSDDDDNEKTTALQAIQQLHALHSMEALPIIALTATVLPLTTDLVEMGINDCLTTPVLAKDIQKAITNAICNTGRSSRRGSGDSLSSAVTMDDSSTIFTSPSMYEMRQQHGSFGSNLTPLTRGTSTEHSSQDISPKMPRRGSFG
ncbi:MAG: hypothetical protein SGARI_004042 [Bacillariaceae sp.]